MVDDEIGIDDHAILKSSMNLSSSLRGCERRPAQRARDNARLM
jgi:hypothetical protein